MKNKNDHTTDFLQDKLENQLQEELEILIKNDQGTKPPEWLVSPQAVFIFLMGGEVDGKMITPKYIGDGALIIFPSTSPPMRKIKTARGDKIHSGGLVP